MTTDLLVEGVHFPAGRLHPSLLGRKAFRVNVSDIAAMGGRPLACVLALAFPVDLPTSDFAALIQGFVEEAERFGTVLAGGDLSRSDRLTLAVTLFGAVESGEPVGRGGAQPGDLLLLIGRVGESRLGLETLVSNPELDLRGLEGEEELRARFAADPRGEWVLAHLLPEIYLDEAQWLQQQGLAHAMLDVSDGLSADVGHLAEFSGLAAVIDRSRLPRPRGVADEARSLGLALGGGEDYALAVAASPQQWARITSELPPGLEPPVVIGRFEAGDPKVWLQTDEGLQPCPNTGFDHFRREEP